MTYLSMEDFNAMLVTLDKVYIANPISTILDFIEENSLSEQQRILFLIFLAKDFPDTQFYFETVLPVWRWPVCAIQLMAVLDNWESAWAHVIVSRNLPYRGTKEHLCSLAVIVS